ncbi:unnamed protein product [Discosporangium mesarthrocarpum]
MQSAVKVLKTFDGMTLRNRQERRSIDSALRKAADMGFTCAVTGDGADEILGGYSFTHGMTEERWTSHRAHMCSVMSFDAIPLGKHYGIHVVSPYTDPKVVKYALTIPKSEAVGERGGKVTGKVPLRDAFPWVFSAERRKDPIEVGSGSTLLGRGYFNNKMTDQEFEAGKNEAADRYGVHGIRDKEHLYYFNLFKVQFPGLEVDGMPRHGSDPCPCCGFQMSSPIQTFCKTCGHYDANLRGGATPKVDSS